MATGFSRFGVYLFPWGKQPPTLESMTALAAHAETLGFGSIHVPWHYTLPRTWVFPEFGNRFLLDPLVIMPALVNGTSRVRLSLNAGVTAAMHPFAWAQYYASLDWVSGGRTIAALALGWWDEDFKVGGAAMNKRGRLADEALDTITRLWRGEEITEPGAFWDATGLRLDPRPRQDPLPLWIGGGEKSVERAARWGSVLMPLTPSPEEVRNTLRPALREAGVKWGTDPGLAIMNYGFVSTVPSAVRDMRERLYRCTKPDLPEGRVLFGNPLACADQADGLFEAGVDEIVIDFQLHGWESAGFGKDQMSRFADEVSPLLGQA